MVKKVLKDPSSKNNIIKHIENKRDGILIKTGMLLGDIRNINEGIFVYQTDKDLIISIRRNLELVYSKTEKLLERIKCEASLTKVQMKLLKLIEKYPNYWSVNFVSDMDLKDKGKLLSRYIATSTIESHLNYMESIGLVSSRLKRIGYEERNPNIEKKAKHWKITQEGIKSIHNYKY